YEKISSTRKRLEILDYLTNFFTELKKRPEDSADLEKIIYLSKGIIYPEIMSQPKLGLAEKTLTDFISKYYSVSNSKMKSILKKTGDLGSTAEKIAITRKGKKGQLTSFMGIKNDFSLSISDIYKKLEEISEISGDKSINRKYSKIKWLFARCNHTMIKYLIRIINSTMRVGISDPSIMDALAVAYLDDKDMRSEIERAYNVHPDLGYVARRVHEEGLNGLKKISIQVGMPIRMMLASRLEYSQILPKLGGEKFISEYKLDGERLQIHKNKDEVKIYSRRLKDITEQYPDVQQSIMKNIEAEKAIIEGEAVAMDGFYEKMLPFQVLITRKRKYDIEETVEKVNVCLFVFDLLYLEQNGKKEQVMDYPLMKRRKLLKEIISSAENLRYVKGKLIQSTDELVEFFREARGNNCEGIMNKSIHPKESVYKAGNRGFLWIKLKSLERGKMTDSIDVVVIGAKWGKGHRVNRYGVLIMAIYNHENEKFEFLTQCGTGFSDENIEDFTALFKPYITEKCPKNVICSGENPDVWFKPAVVMEITGDELTISQKADAGKFFSGKINKTGYSVRFPVFQRIREDKSVKDVTTVKEIIELFKSQGIKNH
ncbi:MAG: ATP-dependent DNA ligase, partial [Promethearchaeota archaeon]